MPLYDVTKIRRNGSTGDRLAMVNARDKKQAATFVANAYDVDHVRVFKAHLKEINDNRKRVNIWNLR